MFTPLVLITVLLIKTVITARILCLFAVPSYSTQQFLIPTCKELSLRGHQVLMVTSYPYNDPQLVNLTEIDLSYMNTFYNKTKTLVQTQLARHGKWPHEIMLNIFNLVTGFSDIIFQDRNFKRIYENPNEHFDLVIVQNMVPTFYSFGARFKAPIIGISSMDGFYNCHDAIGNVNNPAIYSDVLYSDHSYSSMQSRFFRTCYYIFFSLYYHWKILPMEDKRARKYLGNELPYLGDLEKSVSLQFLNGNPLTTQIRPIGPTTIYLTQMHIKPLKELPENLQNILDNAKNGAIYFSLGSSVKSSNIDKKLLETILQDISELPYTVLWKWEQEDFPRKPKNVITMKWFPQQDLLGIEEKLNLDQMFKDNIVAHPNVKVFVCQGGVQSLEEAIVRGVPVVGIPFLIDQPINIEKLEKAGIGIKLDPSTLRRNELKEAILEVAQNSKYKNAIKKHQKIALDQQISGLEKAVWWSEYVIRHNGTEHLRSPTADMPLYKYLFLDIILFIFTMKNLIICLIKLTREKVHRNRKVKTG